jgi:hypothetical protein
MREMLAKSNSHRKSSQEKLEECKSVAGMLDAKLTELKDK